MGKMILTQKNAQEWRIVEAMTYSDKISITVGGFPAGGCDDCVAIEILTKARGVEQAVKIDLTSCDAEVLIEALQKAIKAARRENE
jgi:hypothetical protein